MSSSGSLRVVIGYESMYGTTRHVAEAIGNGFALIDDVIVLPIADVDHLRDGADLLIIGMPTHVHGVPQPTSRRAALERTTPRYAHQEVEPFARVDYGVREWLAELPPSLDLTVAVFDTRSGLPAWLVGHPARQVARSLVKRGATQLGKPESFLLDKEEKLRSGELERAHEWGAQLRTAASQSVRLLDQN